MNILFPTVATYSVNTLRLRGLLYRTSYLGWVKRLARSVLIHFRCYMGEVYGSTSSSFRCRNNRTWESDPLLIELQTS